MFRREDTLRERGGDDEREQGFRSWPVASLVRVRKQRPDDGRNDRDDRSAYVARLVRDFDKDMIVISTTHHVGRTFLQRLQRVLDDATREREPKRLKDVLNTRSGVVDEMDDCTRLPGPANMSDRVTWSVEIKPKCGVLPKSPFISRTLKRKRSRFYMHQRYKLAREEIASCSAYEPLDLFESLRYVRQQDRIEHMANVLEKLARTPQNNFRVFSRGRRVYDEATSRRTRLESVLSETSRFYQKDTNPSCGFHRVVASALLRSRAIEYLSIAQEELNPFGIGMIYPIYQRCVQCVLVENSKTMNRDRFLDKLFDLSVPLQTLPLNLRTLKKTTMDVSNRGRTFTIRLTLEDAIHAVRRYVYWKTLCDVSLFVTFERLHNRACEEHPACSRFMWNGSMYRFRVRIVDTDLKSHRKIPKWYNMDEAIVQHFERSEMAESLSLLNAHDVVEKLRSRALTPSTLLDIVRTRVRRTDSVVHATPILCVDRAKERAKRLRERRLDNDDACLHGLPVLIKDLNDVEGVRTTRGSLLFEHNVPARSGPMVRLLESRDALVVGKTNTPEFGAGSQTFNRLFPTTVSPWDVRTTSGGSSGGAAAALAACQCWLAVRSSSSTSSTHTIHVSHHEHEIHSTNRTDWI